MTEIKYSTIDEDSALTQLGRFLNNTPMPSFSAALENVGGSITSKNLARLLFLNHIYQQIVGIHGVVMDFGTIYGQNAVMFSNLRSIYEPFNRHRKVIAFDTFEGFPSISLEDGNSKLMVQGNLALPTGYEKNLDTLLTLHNALNPAPHIVKHEVVKGDVCDTLPAYLKHNPETIVALAYFDMDLYEPTQKALQILVSDRLPCGSVVAFDELCDHDSPGETQALREVFWCRNFPTIRRVPYCSRTSYFVVGE